MTGKMTEFVWTEAISVGDDSIDTQHKGIFDATNKLLGIVTGERRIEDAYGALVEIERYIRDHFSYEEDYMARNGYPPEELARHRGIHATFAGDFQKRKERVKVEGVSETLVLELENYLGTWLLRHVNEEDMKYARFIRAKQTV